MKPKCLFGKSDTEWTLPDAPLDAPIAIHDYITVFPGPGPDAPKPKFTKLPVIHSTGPKCPGAPRPNRTIHRFRYAPYGSPVWQVEEK